MAPTEKSVHQSDTTRDEGRALPQRSSLAIPVNETILYFVMQDLI
jgi:hypothetical protein